MWTQSFPPALALSRPWLVTLWQHIVESANGAARALRAAHRRALQRRREWRQVETMAQLDARLLHDIGADEGLLARSVALRERTTPRWDEHLSGGAF